MTHSLSYLVSNAVPPYRSVYNRAFGKAVSNLRFVAREGNRFLFRDHTLKVFERDKLQQVGAGGFTIGFAETMISCGETDLSWKE